MSIGTRSTWYVAAQPPPVRRRCSTCGASWLWRLQVDPVTGQTMYVTSRVRENNETLVCANPGNHTCSQTYAFDCAAATDGTGGDELLQGALADGTLGTCTKYAEHVRFMADIERFTLLIEHSVQSSLNEKLRVRARCVCPELASFTAPPHH